MPILIILFIGGLLLYAVIPVTIDFVNLQYTGKSTLLQMWGHFILSNGVTDESWNSFVSLFDGMGVADYVQIYQDAIDTMELE